MKISAAAVDFGTSKIVTLVGESGGYRHADIIGHGEALYDGFIAGHFNDPDTVIAALSASITQAEQQSGRSIKEVYVGVPGEFVKIVPRDVDFKLSEHRKIVDEDVDRILANASKGLVVAGAEILHRNPAYFIVDDGAKTLLPVGQKGSKLYSRVCYVAADKTFLDMVSTWLANLNIKVLGFLSSSLGEALLMVDPEERDRQAVLIDVGYLSTEIMGIEGDAIHQHAIVSMGGAMLTVDLVYGLRVSMGTAELVKRLFTFGASSGPNIEVRDSTGSYSFPREEVSKIIMPRATEIAEHIATTLHGMDMQLGPRAVFYLTGGGFAMMRGAREFLSGILQKPVRITESRSSKLNTPMYASALGLMDEVIERKQREVEPGLGDIISSFFKGIVSK